MAETSNYFSMSNFDGNVIDYHAAVDGSLALVPEGKPLFALEEDYGKMIEADLFQSEVTFFSELMNRLSALQTRANVKNR